MTLSPAEAADSLKQIARTQNRSISAYGYARFSPYLILWGLVWVAGYGGSAILPGGESGFFWLALDAVGLLGCALIGYRQNRGRPADSPQRQAGRRMFGSVFIIVAFIAATFAVMGPVSVLKQAAFWPLVVAQFYALLGLWRGPRFLVTGLALTLLTLGGFFFLRDYFLYWMAVTGGGALILAGLWFRQV